VARRGVDYTVTVSSCAVDDPTDGAGKGTAAYCAVGAGSSAPGPPPPLGAGKVRVLGLDIDVALSGTLLDTVCKAVGTNTDIANSVSAVLSPIAPVAVCPGAGPNAGNAVPIDTDPDDMRRVRVDVSWTRGGAGSVSQTTLLPNPSQN